MSSRELERDIFNRTIQGKTIEVGKLNNKVSTLEHKIKSLNKSVEYWKDKAEKLGKENIYLKNRVKMYDIALKCGTSDLFYNEVIGTTKK